MMKDMVRTDLWVVPHPQPRLEQRADTREVTNGLDASHRHRLKEQWSPRKASTSMSCKSYSLSSLLQTLLPSLKFVNLFWLAHFPGYIARSVFITIKPKDIQEYATRPSLEIQTPW